MVPVHFLDSALVSSICSIAWKVEVVIIVSVVLYFLSYAFVGIGNPPGAMDMKAFLLQKFSSVERQQVIPSNKDNYTCEWLNFYCCIIHQPIYTS